MHIGHSHIEYDSESEYWQDIEDAHNMQIEAQKNLPSDGIERQAQKNMNDSSILTCNDYQCK